MANYGIMSSDLQLLLMASLLTGDVGTLLNRAQREEVEAYEWSFLHTNIIINAVVPLSNGTVTLTQGSTAVTGTGTTFTGGAAGWWLRVGPTLTVPVLVGSIQDDLNLTLSRPWGASSVSAVGYSFFPRFYSTAPLIEVYNVQQIELLDQVSETYLNYADPARNSTGGSPCLKWAPADFDSNGNYQIELWPIATSALPYIVTGKIGPATMINNTDMPQVPSAVLEAKVMLTAAMANFAATGSDKWAQLAQMWQGVYQTELDRAIIADKKRAVTLGLHSPEPRSRLGYDYVTAHDTNG